LFIYFQESDFGGGDVGDAAAEDSDYAVNRKSRKSSSRKSSSHNTPTTQSQEPTTGMPTIEEVCNTFGLTDVQIEYSDADFQNLTTYKLFQQHVRPLLAKENPKVRTVFLYTFFSYHIIYNYFIFIW
jgi:chromodomain-helicase-DNA-binding protein 4